MRYFYIFPLSLMLYEFALYMSNDMYTPAFPLIAHDFATTNEMVQLTLTSWLLGGVIAQLVLGPLSDRFGRRLVLFLGAALFLISCVACIFSSTITSFILARFLQGIGVCSMMIAGYACIHETYDDKDALYILSLMSAVSVIAPMLGPLFGGYLIVFADWRVIFVIVGVLAAIAVVALAITMPRDKPQHRVAFDVKNIIRDFYLLIKNRGFMLNALMFGLFYGGSTLWIVASPFILMTHFHLNSKEFGWIQLPIFAAFIGGAHCMRLLRDKLPSETFIKIGIIGGLIATSLLIVTTLVWENFIGGIIICMSLYTFSFGIANAPLNRLAFNNSTVNKGVTASMFYTCMMSLGSLVTIISGLIAVDNIIGYAALFLGLAITSLILYQKS